MNVDDAPYMSLSRSSVQSTPKNPLSHWQVPVAPESLADAEQRPIELSEQGGPHLFCVGAGEKVGSRHASRQVKGEESAPRQPTWAAIDPSSHSQKPERLCPTEASHARSFTGSLGPEGEQPPVCRQVHDGAGGVTGDGATAGGVAGEGATDGLKLLKQR